MNNPERGIIIGRFQPLHNGHLLAIHQMDQDPDFEEIIIGIGSSQVDHTVSNPFTCEEREEMIRKNLDIKKPYQVIPIPDINDFPQWVTHVESLTPKFSVAYAGNPLVQKLFAERGYKVKPLERIGNISATEIRQKMILGGQWEEHLPQGSLEVIAKTRGVDRLREAYLRYFLPNVTVDAIIRYSNQGVILIQRKDGNIEGGKWALPGGFLDTGKECGKQGVVREVREETKLILDPLRVELFGEYSDPGRDTRHHTVTLVYETEVDGGEYEASDDAQDIGVFHFDKLPPLAFNHGPILMDYIRKKGIQI